jgi:hypothetical protein
VILKPGMTLVSVVDATTILVVKAPADDVTVTCGAEPMTDPASAPSGRPTTTATTAAAGGAQLGKRYTDEAGSIELLCTKGGSGVLAVDGTALTIKQAKPLPASD